MFYDVFANSLSKHFGKSDARGDYYFAIGFSVRIMIFYALLMAGLRFMMERNLVERLMREMGLEAIYPKPRLSSGGGEHWVYAYVEDHSKNFN